MPFFDFAQMPLKDFRPGIKSSAQVGEQLILAAGIPHGWSAEAGPVKIMDVSAKPSSTT
jgi:hypothetical protein